MPWWGWVAAGMMMLVAELALVDAAFYLVFRGVSALLVGTPDLPGISLPFWMQWTLFAVLVIASTCGEAVELRATAEPRESKRVPGAAWDGSKD